MRILINNIKMPIKHKIEDVLLAAQDIVRQHCVFATDFSVYKQSIDARRKSAVCYVYSVSAKVDESIDLSSFNNVSKLSMGHEIFICNTTSFKKRPIVVGLGPCGLFCAYILALSGNPPLIIERGDMIENREKSVEKFWKTGQLDINSNVQFGEGGAGTFSDGKLNTGVKDIRQRFILKTFVDFGAPQDILYKAKPHIGTDALKNVIINMRKKLIELGCEIRFNTTLTNIKVVDKRITEIEINGDEAISCEKVFLGIGHSSRDTYEMLLKSNVFLEQKSFAAGVRVEHKQSMISKAQYGEVWSELPPADYKLVYNGKDRSCYSFCMCPGGFVVNASSEPDCLVVNGMSNHKRDAENANSALVVTVRPDDFESDSPLSGVEFQRKYERLAFYLGGGDYTAPIQLVRDFVSGKHTSSLGDVKPSFTGKTAIKDLNKCLPKFISNTLVDGLNYFDKRISGFASGDGVLTGVEMRTSSPVRIVRNIDFEAQGISGLYPIGEGAGYAGGIISAALDGIKASLSAIEKY